jgi:hypothetical protein
VSTERLRWLTAILPVYKKTLGSGGIRPCTLAFRADQLDRRDKSARNDVRTVQTFFNWYYTVLGSPIVFAATVIVYIQHSYGFLCSIMVHAATRTGPAASLGARAIR